MNIINSDWITNNFTDIRKSTVLLPIKPKYVDMILDGRKKYEFRKINMFPANFVFYATVPVKKIVAESEIDYTVVGTPAEVWDYCKDDAGISKADYDKYYEGRDIAVAFRLKNVEKLGPYELLEFGVRKVPQNYIYIDERE